MTAASTNKSEVKESELLADHTIQDMYKASPTKLVINNLKTLCSDHTIF